MIDKEQNGFDGGSSLDKEQLFFILSHYSGLAIKSEISHTLNNMLSALAINRTLLSRSLGSGDYSKVADRADSMGKAIDNLKEFSASLSLLNLISPKPENVVLNDLLRDTVKVIMNFTPLGSSEILLDLCEDNNEYFVDADSFRVLVTFFILSSMLIFSTPTISIKTEQDSNTGDFRITAYAKGERKTEMKAIDKNINCGKEFGNVTLETIIRIVQSSNRNAKISLIKSNERILTCHISLTSQAGTKKAIR